MRCRPSALYSINGEWRQFCFDRAVTTFGMALEAELDKIDGKNAKSIEGKRMRLLNKWLDRPQQYRNPVATAKNADAGPTSSADVDQTFVMRGDGGG